ncbi:phage head-tail connector protein [Rhizobium sp. KVB221]|uniref:Phage head-tail connector protein n=1 Tax=Rhizobium setariae TaxID=2801340 RepID=A0A936YQP9_9HYPH|nr:head-tail connector protein [Rhizobium setariae]MBL0371071.1 phage head-tail connector protein [Rhizobium setariae]
MTYALTNPPLAEPLTLAQVKAHMRIDGSDEDDLLLSLLRTAREHLERTTGLALIAQAFRLYLVCWPESGIVEIARGPVKAIDEIRVFDANGEEAIISLAGHVLDGNARPARLYLRQRPVPGEPLNGIEIDFTAGFGDTGADVPDALKRAMLTHVARMYEFRGAVAPDQQPADVPEGYERLVAPFLMKRL